MGQINQMHTTLGKTLSKYLDFVVFYRLEAFDRKGKLCGQWKMSKYTGGGGGAGDIYGDF